MESLSLWLSGEPDRAADGSHAAFAGILYMVYQDTSLMAYVTFNACVCMFSSSGSVVINNGRAYEAVDRPLFIVVEGSEIREVRGCWGVEFQRWRAALTRRI